MGQGGDVVIGQGDNVVTTGQGNTVTELETDSTGTPLAETLLNTLTSSYTSTFTRIVLV